MAKELAKYKDSSGQEITITDVDVVRVFCDNPAVTQREVKLFVELCKAQRLNPFIREAYLVKYGDKPASLVVGKDVYTKRAQANPRFKGMQAGIFVTRDGKGKEREGSMVLPIYDSVAFEEYANRRKDGKLGGSWAKMPGTMIRKVAMVHALREAFPDEFQGLYDAAEMGVDGQEEQPEQAEQPIDVEAEVIEPPSLMDARNDLWKAMRAWCAATTGLEGEELDARAQAEWQAQQIPMDRDEARLTELGYTAQWFEELARSYGEHAAEAA